MDLIFLNFWCLTKNEIMWKKYVVLKIKNIKYIKKILIKYKILKTNWIFLNFWCLSKNKKYKKNVKKKSYKKVTK